MSTVIKAENISKQYRLGLVGTGTVRDDLKRWWHNVRGKEDPFLKIGEANDRAVKGESDYVWSLKDINFEINQGDSVGIIGRNGAGKSTLLKILSQVTQPTTGKIYTKGRIASLLEVGTGFHPEMTGRENIYLNGAILGMRKHEITRKLDEIIAFSGVERYIDTPVKRYSSGMYVRLAFAVAAHLESEILIVDEVLAVGDAEFQKKCLGKMNDVSKGEGRTVLFVSHNMGAIKNLCNKGIVLDNGVVTFQGDTTDAINKYLITNKKTKTETTVCISDLHRRFNMSKEIEILSVSLLNPLFDNCFSTSNPIKLLFEVKFNKPIKSYRIAGSIFTIEDYKVGTFFTEANENLNDSDIIRLEVTLIDHNLSKGNYYFAFSVGNGDEESGNVEYDIIYEVLNFEITHKADIESPINNWPNNWGNICFQSKLEYVNE